MISDMKAKLTILKMMRKNRFLLIDEEGMKILSFFIVALRKTAGYQEVFISPKCANGSKSIRIYGCEQDIGSMLKKSFFGGRSVLDVHSLRSFPVKLYLDGVLSGKRLDKEMLNYDKPLSLCQSSKDVPNFIIDVRLSLEEIKYYLSLQNW